MKKIERQMIAAIKCKVNMSFGNTQVSHSNSKTSVLLHGNEIARRDGTDWLITCAGWNTVTTRSRLNALSKGLDLRYTVFQRDYQLYFKAQGDKRIAINPEQIVSVPAR